MLKVLIIGNGGREHAIAWKLAQDHRIGRLYVAPGNAGICELENSENVPLTEIPDLIEFAQNNDVDLTIVGSETLLVAGIVDRFQENALTIFGPDRKSARLEGSKSYAKSFMQRYGVRTGGYRSFSRMEAALQYLDGCPFPVVVKASGLAAGKGVVICKDRKAGEQAVRGIMAERRFGEAGAEIVIEEYLEGFEVSVLGFCDGNTILPMLSAKDHKTIGDNNSGANTGGMGVVAPHPELTEAQYRQFIDDILTPTLNGIRQEELRFSGVVFFGLMVTERGVFLLEYNMRMGDPETQTILPLLKNHLLDPIEACIAGNLARITLEWEKKTAVCVVAASSGYPEKYRSGLSIAHIEKARFFTQVFLAGAKSHNGEYFTSGGRVLNVVGIADTLEQARAHAYSGIRLIHFEGITYRKDIGLLQNG